MPYGGETIFKFVSAVYTLLKQQTFRSKSEGVDVACPISPEEEQQAWSIIVQFVKPHLPEGAADLVNVVCALQNPSDWSCLSVLDDALLKLLPANLAGSAHAVLSGAQKLAEEKGIKPEDVPEAAAAAATKLETKVRGLTMVSGLELARQMVTHNVGTLENPA